LDPSSTHLGGVLSGHLHLPRTYGTFAGVEIAHLPQLVPGTYADQWRLNVEYGWAGVAAPGESRVTPELALRAGFFRGANGPLVWGGLLGGLNAALGIRITGDPEPWQRDGLLLTAISLVPQISINTLVPEFRFADVAPEISAGVGVRATLSSTLLP
jgi:hypothetical protein